MKKGRAEEFHKDSVTDSLTGIYNRRIINVLDELIHDIYSVIIVDMNNFKNINDTYGHNYGDIVLKKAADIIHLTTRASDYLIRYGGDEFLLLLPGCNKSICRELEKRLYKDEDNFHVKSDGSEIIFSFTSGIYTAEKGEKIENAINKADADLYRKKKLRK